MMMADLDLMENLEQLHLLIVTRIDCSCMISFI